MTAGGQFESSLNLLLVETKKVFGFDAAAVRVVDPFGYMPFAVHDGVSSDFFDDESVINVNVNCICGKVIRAEIQPGLPFYTEQGSFWTNSLSKSAGELEKAGIQIRKRCLEAGYETVLIAPIKQGKAIRGSLFFASRKKNLLTREDVELLENTAVMASEEVFTRMKECDRFASIIRLVALGDGKNKKDFTEFINHIQGCPSCHNFYSERMKFDDIVRKSMTRISPPAKLKFSIIQEINKGTRS
jgi:hypothetical protein